MSTKEATTKALNKYYESNKKIGVNVSTDIYELIENYCKQMNISKRELIEKAVTNYIDNN